LRIDDVASDPNVDHPPATGGMMATSSPDASS
jgi:hypothetical protein